MSLELEDMQQQIDKMTNEELAQVAMRMMEVRGGAGLAVAACSHPQDVCTHSLVVAHVAPTRVHDCLHPAQGKAQPQQLLRVGSSLYRRALSFTTTMTSPRAVSMIMRLEGDGTAQLSELCAESMEQVCAGCVWVGVGGWGWVGVQIGRAHV